MSVQRTPKLDRGIQEEQPQNPDELWSNTFAQLIICAREASSPKRTKIKQLKECKSAMVMHEGTFTRAKRTFMIFQPSF